MYRVRFHGRGGQGIKTASRILGSALFQEGFEVQDAPVYGAERRGAPLNATVRAARAPIHERGAINHPDLVIVADESLVPIAAAGVLLGVLARTVLLINSSASADAWRARLNLAGPIVTLPVSAGIEGRAQLPYVGALCVGAAARLLGCVTRAALDRAIGEELRDLGAEVVARNRDQALGAYDRMQPHAGIVIEGGEIAARDYTPPAWVELPFEEARRSAPDIHAAATSVQIKTGAWRSMRPVIDDALCKRCTWVCSTLCPDSAIRVEAGRPVIDYDHCKGCLVCVAVCPPHAIRAVPEAEFQEPPSPSLPREGGGEVGVRP
jgi:pyruvate ferredoxin oxidoreductase gamma subunit